MLRNGPRVVRGLPYASLSDGISAALGITLDPSALLREAIPESFSTWTFGAASSWALAGLLSLLRRSDLNSG